MNTASKHVNDAIFNLPVFGNSADIQQGGFVKRGLTGTQPYGALISANGTSATPGILGRLLEKHVYATTGDTLAAGTSFVTHPVQLSHPFRVHRVEYDLASVITCTQAVSTTTITVTSLEDDIDTAFLYVAVGTGIGQTNYLTAAAGGSATLKAAFGTNLDTTSKFIKILPRFHRLTALNSDGTKLASQAAAGGIIAHVIDSYIQKNGAKMEQLNPTKHDVLTGLNSLRSIKFFADIAIVDSLPYAIA